jgi:tetratricopeptide (TPR) repeat protein
LDKYELESALEFFDYALSVALQILPSQFPESRRRKLFNVYIKLAQTNIRRFEFDQVEDLLRVAEAHISLPDERKLFCYYKALSVIKNRHVAIDYDVAMALYTEAITIDPKWAKAFVMSCDRICALLTVCPIHFFVY